MPRESGDENASDKRAIRVDCIPGEPTHPSNKSKSSDMDIITETLPFIDDPDGGNDDYSNLKVTMKSNTGRYPLVDGNDNLNIRSRNPADHLETRETFAADPARRTFKKHHISRKEETSHLQVQNDVTKDEEWHDVSLEEENCETEGNAGGSLDHNLTSHMAPAGQASALMQKTSGLFTSPRHHLLQSASPHTRQSHVQKKYVFSDRSTQLGSLHLSSLSAPLETSSSASAEKMSRAVELSLPYRSRSSPVTVRKDLTMLTFKPASSERSFAKSMRRMSWVVGVTRKNRNSQPCPRHNIMRRLGDDSLTAINSKNEGMMYDAKTSNQRTQSHFQEMHLSETEKLRFEKADKAKQFRQSAGPATAAMLATARHLERETRHLRKRLSNHLLSVLMCGLLGSQRPPHAVQQLLQRLQQQN
ncbi:hypothetical protein ACOMHN_055995 [Nucella lapillus]